MEQAPPSRFPLILAACFVVFFVLLGIAPASRQVWWAENIPVMAMFLLLAATSHRFATATWPTP